MSTETLPLGTVAPSEAAPGGWVAKPSSYMAASAGSVPLRVGPGATEGIKPLRVAFLLATASMLAAATAMLLAETALGGADAKELSAGQGLAYASCVAVGLVTGFLSGLLGIGGALVTVPALYLLLPSLGVADAQLPHTVVATSLLAMVPTMSAASWWQMREGAMSMPWLLRLGPGLALGAVIGGVLARHLAGPTLALLFALQSLDYGWHLMRSKGACVGRVRKALSRCAARSPAPMVGLLTGGFCCCAGMGAGSITVPYLQARGVPLLTATAVSTASNLGVAVGGSLAFALAAGMSGSDASPCLPAALLIGLAATLTARRGVLLAHRLPVDVFRRVLGGVTMFAAVAILARTAWAAAG